MRLKHKQTYTIARKITVKNEGPGKTTIKQYSNSRFFPYGYARRLMSLAQHK